MAPLRQVHLEEVVSVLAQRLDSLQIDYAIMGGAAVCLIASTPERATQDVDMVVHVDHQSITADKLTEKLITTFPGDFQQILQLGHPIPGYKLNLPPMVFDQASWPQRRQYNLKKASRLTRVVKGRPVKFFSAEWIMREKILSRYQRQGFKSQIDLQDVVNLLRYARPGLPELDFDSDQELQAALTSLLEEMPALRSRLSGTIKCKVVFG
ncbi:uncharacterized protein N7483_011344 [Penicillium malachiteum]|uniref:uncharacterized protein n=1 Tax=Penicillium malachiteum TaxID=1324776 RepID=UPI002548C6DA|nr:uncharacterized protein N7483_011344 [Penicillium malachiteum]KAJ5714163.1 hypothetical protein N7483_011344 [Penicillium malachiteum]